VLSFPQYRVLLKGADGAPGPLPAGAPPPAPPFRVTFPPREAQAAAPGSTRTGATSRDARDAPVGAGGGGGGGEDARPVLLVEAYVPENPGPYPQDQPRRNSVKFTPVQVGSLCARSVRVARPRAGAQLASASLSALTAKPPASQAPHRPPPPTPPPRSRPSAAACSRA
jgi:hypothetical protein